MPGRAEFCLRTKVTTKKAGKKNGMMMILSPAWSF